MEITDVNKAYLELGELHVELLGHGFAWLDTGTHASLLEASQFIETVERRQSLIVADREEKYTINDTEISTLYLYKYYKCGLTSNNCSVTCVVNFVFISLYPSS